MIGPVTEKSCVFLLKSKVLPRIVHEGPGVGGGGV